MKKIRHFAVLAAFLFAAPALAQQVQNHAVPIGAGAGVTGFRAAVPAASGQPMVSQGPAADPAFGTIGNSGFTPGAANTAKGSLDGTTVTDIPLPSCTAVNQAWRYASGVGINCASISVTAGFDTPVNLGLSASAAAGALTINVTQRDGTAPSVSSPVLVPFRSLVATTGTVAYSTISSALSVTIPSGATLGTSSSNVPFRIWIFLDANGGTPSVGVATCSNATAIFPCASWENTLKTSITISSGATSAGTLYASAGVTLDAVRIVGFCDFATGLGTAGTWASACTTLQVFGPGIKKPGDVVQYVRGSSTTTATTTSATFAALSGGATQAITPTSAANLVKARMVGSATITNGAAAFLQITHTISAVTTLIDNPVSINISGAATVGGSAILDAFDAPGVTSAVTYSYQGKINAGNTLTYPAASSGITISLEEIMG